MRPDRLHDLDALRAFAMLLGAALHACTDFVPWYDTSDSTARQVLRGTTGLVHGFRMPLFFAVSGFFTALLWQRRAWFPCSATGASGCSCPGSWRC